MYYKVIKQADWGTCFDYFVVLKSEDNKKWTIASDKTFSYITDAQKYIDEMSHENVQTANEGSIS